MVVGSGRNEVALRRLKTEGHVTDYIVADVTEAGACASVVESAVRLLGGRLSVLVNGAGALTGGAVGDPDVGLENYERNMSVNARAPFELMVRAIPHLRRAAADGGDASVVNVSSVNGKRSFASCATYCMSKAAVDQLTRCASVDLAKDGIRVNSVNPGVTRTNIHTRSGMPDDQYEAFIERSVNVTHPLAKSLQRVAEPEEVGELVAFLVSDRAKFITGECIAIDGARQNLGAR